MDYRRKPADQVGNSASSRKQCYDPLMNTRDVYQVISSHIELES